MLQKILLLFLLVVFAIYGIQYALQNDRLLQYLDQHPNPTWVPRIEYVVAGGYVIFSENEEASRYYNRVADQYPQSSLADNAAFSAVEAMDNIFGQSHSRLAELYQSYLDRFPQGRHAELAQHKVEVYRSH